MKIYQLSFLVIFFVFSVLCSVTVSAGKDFEFDTVQDYEDDYNLNVDAGGTVVPEMKPARAREKFSVIFENKYDNETVELFWVSETGEEFSMGDIYSGNSVRIDTTVYHTFVGKGKQSKDFVNPRVITITPNKHTYTFIPVEVRRGIPSPKPFIQVLNRPSTSAAAKFRNLIPETVDVYYDDGRGGSYQGSLDLGKEYTVNSYVGHVFFFTPKGNKEKVYARHRVRADKVLYVVEDPSNPPPEHMLEHLAKEEAFMAEYQNRTGLQWRHYFGPDGPRAPPVHHMWPAKEIGQKHHVTTDAGYWRCLNYAQADCQSPEPITFELEVISLRPKAFLVKNFFTEMEAEAIVAYAGPRMASSFVGNRDGGGARKSETRTSQNTWLPRGSFEITETLFHRAEQILNISRLDFHNTEDLQVVHYVDGQKYDAHHDWGVSGYASSRYITLLLYLNDMASIDAGGETSFPKGADGTGFKVHPGKGNAVFFYNLLEDGNGDDLSLHAALPVVKGEKWLANFWVWDPQRR